VYSWRNLNPTQNRKNIEVEERELAISTRHAEMERFKAFIRFCVDSEYMARNLTHKVKLEPRSSDQRRFGLSQEEYERVEAEAHLWANCHGNHDGAHAKRLQTIIPLLRYTGLRISDAATLAHEDIIPRVDGSGYAVYRKMNKVKRQGPVYVPLPESVYERLMALPVRGTKEGRRYFFWSCGGAMHTCIKAYQNDIAEVMRRAQSPDAKTGRFLNPFSHSASVHTLRHTFATLAAARGVPLQQIRDWLGHASIQTTERFYIHACPERNRASESHFDEMMKAYTPKPKPNVIRMKKRA
jgi:integrase